MKSLTRQVSAIRRRRQHRNPAEVALDETLLDALLDGETGGASPAEKATSLLF
jgi:hypothetical protein